MKAFLIRLYAKIRGIIAVVDWKDVGRRTLKTFGETAGAFIIAAFKKALEDGSLDVAVHSADTMLISALSAGLCAVLNGVLVPVLKAMKRRADQEL